MHAKISILHLCEVRGLPARTHLLHWLFLNARIPISKCISELVAIFIAIYKIAGI